MAKVTITQIKKAVEENTLWQVLLVGVIILFTFLLRSIHADRVPEFGHLEEHLYGWSGLYLIETGTPVSWSTLDYPEDKVVYSGKITGANGQAKAYVDLVKPWLDEPPLFSLIVGTSAHIFGADRHQLIPSAFLRFPILIIDLFTSIILFLLARKLFGYWIAAGAVLFWGTIPLMVFSSRLAVPENAIACLYLLCLYLYLIYIDRKKNLPYLLLLILPGVAGLMKPTGFFIAPLLTLFFFQKKQFKKGSLVLLATLPFVAAFLIYGLSYDPKSFLHILSIQGFRPSGWGGLGFLLSSPAFDIFPFYDSWYIFSLIAALFFILRQDKDNSLTFICWALLYWILVVVFSGGEQDLLPWYRYPLFPILSIFTSLGIRYLISNPNFITATLVTGFFIGNRTYLVNAFHSGVKPTVFRTEFLLLVLPSVLYTIWQKEYLKKLTIILMISTIVLGIGMNISVVKNYYSLICEAKHCPIGPSTWLTR